MNKKRITLIALVVFVVITILWINAHYFLSLFTSSIIASNVEDIPGDAPDGTYPLLFVHGYNTLHSERVSELTFKSMQEAIAHDLNYSDRGILIDETTCAQLRYQKEPIVIRTSYFSDPFENVIENHVENLNRQIDRIVYCTGAQKIDLVTHSMGGIVTRSYLKNYGSDHIRKVVMLGTPNHGGLYNIAQLTELFIEEGESKIQADFIQLSENHIFMQELNTFTDSQDQTTSNSSVEYYTIAGNKDGIGDGIIRASSVPLSVSHHHEVDCSHFALTKPFLCPEGYDIVVSSLS